MYIVHMVIKNKNNLKIFEVWKKSCNGSTGNL